MVSVKGDITETPTFNTNRPANSLKRWTLYVLGLGMLLTAFRIASGTVAPMFENVVASLTGGRVQGGDAPTMEF